MIEQPHPAVIQGWQECQPLSVAPDGALVVYVDSLKHELEFAGIELPQPPPPAYFELLNRIRGIQKPMRCRFVGGTRAGRARADVLYFAWQDKSGDVWLNLATTLIEQGLARPAEGQVSTQ